MIGFLFDLLYLLPLYLFSVLSCEGILHLESQGGLLWVVSMIFALSVAGFCNSNSRLKYLIPGVFAVGALGFVFAQEKSERLPFLTAHIWVLWVLLAAGAFYIIGKLAGRNSLVRRGITVLLFGYLIYAMCTYQAVSKAAVILAFLQVMLYLLDEIQLHWVKSGSSDRRQHLVYITPFVFVICLAAYLIPFSEEPYDWQIAKTAWKKVSDAAKTISSLIPSGEDESAKVGFSEKAIMQGVIQRYPKELLVMESAYEVPKVVYLGGKSFDTYAGNEWSSVSHEELNCQIMDTIELQCAARKAGLDSNFDYIKRAKIRIKYDLFHTKYVFVPLKMETEPNSNIKIAYKDVQDSLMASRRIPYGTDYEVSFYRLNSDQVGFDALIEDSSDITEEEWNNGRKKYFSGDDTKCTYSDYLRYKELMRSCYSEEIILSDQLQAKLNEVYDGAESDWEKLKRIEAWLGEFTYSTKPGAIPETVQTASDYLDYFLLEKQEGYCMHYATAFTLLARAQGFPARFMQGLYVNRGDRKSVLVTADEAHAWPEVYFENVGWIAFEPTPKYHKDLTWEPSGTSASGGHKSSFDPMALYGHHNETEGNPNLSEFKSENENTSRSVNIWIVLIPAMAVVMFIVCFIFVYRFIDKRRFDKLDANARARAMCELNLQILSYLGIQLKEGQTLEELGHEIEEELGTDSAAFIGVYEAFLYSNVKVDAQMLSVIERSKSELMHALDLQKRYTKWFYHIMIGM